jgi:hypothetical protein
MLISHGLFSEVEPLTRSSRISSLGQSDKAIRDVGHTGLLGQLAPDWDEWLMGFPVG